MKGHVMKNEKSRLAYNTPELNVMKLKMETEFLTATSMMRKESIQSNIADFDGTVAAPFDKDNDGDGDITLIL
jgi:hypothetical protein